MEKDLWLFTTRFPQGTSESFLENELPVLARRFKRITVFPLFPDEGMRTLPDNVEMRRLFDDPFRSAPPAMMLRHLGLLRTVLVQVRSSAPDAVVHRKHRREIMSHLRQALQRLLTMRAVLDPLFDPHRHVLYSYWTADWATVLGLWKMGDPRVRYISRMHGFDLYDERSPDGWPPFRSLQLRQCGRFFVASQAGLDHLRARHPQHAHKFHLARLGTSDHGLAAWSPAPVLRIVSCSNLVPLKRVHLLSDALRQVKAMVEWTHFGDGPERDRVEASIHELPPNVKATLMGGFANRDLLSWYTAHPADLFVHVSESEGGVPVALQEAASFGIPLMACDSGGVKEIVNERTGLLLPHDPLPRQIAQLIGEHATSPRNTAGFRAGVREEWGRTFRAEEVFGTFADQLLRS